jgi:hypothetical protein
VGQITPATIKMIDEYAARGERAPLTVWELQQLARAWEKASAAVEHHRLGYDLTSPAYDENNMIALMDDLGEALK